jgi:hypothetical protein
MRFGTENRILYRPFCYLTLIRSASLFQHTRKSSLQGEVNVVSVHSMKAYGRVEVKLHSFLTSTLNGDKPSPSCFGRSTPGKKNTELVEHKVGRRAELDVLEKRKIFWRSWIPNHILRLSSQQPSHCTDGAVQIHWKCRLHDGLKGSEGS